MSKDRNRMLKLLVEMDDEKARILTFPRVHERERKEIAGTHCPTDTHWNKITNLSPVDSCQEMGVTE